MNKETLLDAYRRMLVLRGLDEKCLELKMQDLIMDGFHPYSGQEACAVGASLWLKPEDFVISNHRPQGHSLAKGSAAKAVFCEMLGRCGGISEGIGGPMQWIDSDNNFYCGSIVGSGMTIANGVAMALKRENKGRVCVCWFGDGASNTGSFHEAMNLASIWKLPTVFLLENNQYAEAMPVAEFVSCLPISKRGEAYGINGVTVDGNDVEQVYEAVGKAIEGARTGTGPYFIEFVTYRTRGHYGGDPEHTYRTKEEVAEWRGKCPIARAAERLVAMGCDRNELDALAKAVDRELEQDKAWALEQRFPTVEEATSHVMIQLDSLI